MAAMDQVSPARDRLDEAGITARLFVRAALPVMKVVLQDDPRMARKFRGVTAPVVLAARTGEGLYGACLNFTDGVLSFSEDLPENPPLSLLFPNLEKMNDMLSGGKSLPSIKGGLGHPLLLVKTLTLLLSLKLMMPSARPSDPAKRAMKVKMALYMITTALSTLNKLEDPKMKAWTTKQPDRIYQFSVEPVEKSGIAAYLRVKAGQSKAGRGVYTRRRPFVHFRFSSVDGALKVLLNDVEFVSGVEQGCVRIDGSPEYAAQLNDFMAVLQNRMTQ
jgi:hypothetical protein